MDPDSVPRNPWFDPDLTQLPTPSPVEPAIPLEEFQREMEQRRAVRLYASDRVFPVLGWRNLLAAVVSVAVVWAVIWWVVA